MKVSDAIIDLKKLLPKLEAYFQDRDVTGEPEYHLIPEKELLHMVASSVHTVVVNFDE